MSPALEGGFLTTRPPEKTSLVAQTVKRLSTMRESQVLSLGWEDPLEKEMAIHSRTIAWKIPWTEEPGRLQPMGSQRVRHDWATSLSFSLYIYWYICLGGGREHRVTAWDGRRAWSNKYSIWRYSTKLFFWSHVSYCPKWYQESSDPELFRWSVDSVSIDYFSLWSKFPVAGTWWTLPLVSYHAFTCFCHLRLFWNLLSANIYALLSLYL